MADYTWPSVYFAYSFFVLMVALAAFFFVKTVRDGYWGERGEDVKFHMFDDGGERRSS